MGALKGGVLRIQLYIIEPGSSILVRSGLQLNCYNIQLDDYTLHRVPLLLLQTHAYQNEVMMAGRVLSRPKHTPDQAKIHPEPSPMGSSAEGEVWVDGCGYAKVVQAMVIKRQGVILNPTELRSI